MIQLRKRFGIATMLSALTLSLFCSCGNGGWEEAIHHIKYVAVQKEKDAYWSIIDENGNVVVKEEYEPECIISEITDDGVYWVLSSGKLKLYSVDNPKRSVSSREFDAVHSFCSGRAFAVENAGDQIELIDDNGEIIKTLPKNITGVYPFQEEMAQYKDANGKWGYLDIDGDVKIEARYFNTSDFSEGYALVQKERNGDIFVINTSGKEIATIKNDKYSGFGEFHDGVISCDKNNEERETVFLDTEGKEAVSLSKNMSGISDGFRNGRAIICNFDNGSNFGLIDKQGEFVIRIGRYENICYVGDGFYAAEKGGKYGIIDGDDNEIIDFRYDGVVTKMMGDNFVMYDGNEYILVNKNGEEVRGSEFINVSNFEFTASLNYYDIEGLAKKVADYYSPEGYLPLKGADSCEALAKLLGSKMEDCRWKEYFTHATDSGDISVETKIHLDRFAVKTKYRTETINDGWFEYQREVEDGLMWNDKAGVKYIKTCVTLTDNKMAETFAKTIIPMLKSRGFVNELDDNRFGDAENKVSIEVESSGIAVYIIMKFNE